MAGPAFWICSVPVPSAPQLPAASCPRIAKAWLPSLSLAMTSSGIAA
jgi:hypothetical protein